MTKHLTVGEVRFSYMNVFKPRAAKEGQQEKYSVTCLLPKSNVEMYNRLMSELRAEALGEAEGKLKGVSIDHVRHPVHDGDGVKQDGTPYPEECKGHWVFTASANPEYPPRVVDQNVMPIMDQSKIYSGAYGYVAIGIYAYSNQTKGIAFGLNGIQKSKDGEPFGFSFDANSAFSVLPTQQSTQQVDPITGMPITDDKMPF